MTTGGTFLAYDAVHVAFRMRHTWANSRTLSAVEDEKENVVVLPQNTSKRIKMRRSWPTMVVPGG
jgi:hypothetical protein